MTEEKVIEETSEEIPPALPTTAPPGDESLTEKPAGEETKTETKAEEEPKPIEPPANINEEPLKWLGQQIPQAVHKVNYLVLEWLGSLIEEDPEKRQPIPGSKTQATTKNQFINFLKDGHFLATLANKLSPGSIETIHEGEALKSKDNQKANLQGFIDWAKNHLELAEDQIMSPEDLLEKGKQGFNSVFGTLWQLATRSHEKFGKEPINVDAVTEAAGQAVKTNIIQTILNFFKRARPQTTQSAKQAAIEQEEKERAEKSKEQEKEVDETEKTETVVAPAAVAAN